MINLPKGPPPLPRLSNPERLDAHRRCLRLVFRRHALGPQAGLVPPRHTGGAPKQVLPR